MPEPTPPPHPEPARWVRVREEPHADCRVFRVEKRVMRHPRRSAERDFFVLHSPDWVNVLALDAEDRLVLARQFRFGTLDFSLEVPGGLLEPGEDPVVGGLRELAEETGYTAGAARIVGSVNPNPAIQANTCYFVLAEGCRATRTVAWDHDEEVEVVLRPAREALADARAGRIRHALTINALFHLAALRGW